MSGGDPRATLAIDDILTAGAEGALTLMRIIAEAASGDLPANPAEVDGWLRLSVADALRGFLDGSARVCAHNPTLCRHEPIFSCAWKPALVVCAQCIPLLKPTKKAAATCDRCGRVCASLADGGGIHPLIVQLGLLTFQAGACPDCRPDPPVQCEQSTTNTTEETHR